MTAAAPTAIPTIAPGGKPLPPDVVLQSVIRDRVADAKFEGRGKGDDAAPAGLSLPVVEGAGVQWKLGADLGRRYGAVSGDRNPIHLYAATAKAFGFSRQIAHGMWSKARCIAAVENRLPDAVRVETAFKTPILLPATVRFTAESREDGLAFSLTNPRNDAPHLTGRAAAL